MFQQSLKIPDSVSTGLSRPTELRDQRPGRGRGHALERKSLGPRSGCGRKRTARQERAALEEKAEVERAGAAAQRWYESLVERSLRSSGHADSLLRLLREMRDEGLTLEVFHARLCLAWSTPDAIECLMRAALMQLGAEVAGNLPSPVAMHFFEKHLTARAAERGILVTGTPDERKIAIRRVIQEGVLGLCVQAPTNAGPDAAWVYCQGKLPSDYWVG